MENTVTGDRDMVMLFLLPLCTEYSSEITLTQAQICNCVHTITNTKPGGGGWVGGVEGGSIAFYSMTVVYEQKAPLKYRTALELSIGV